jgi:hypothetical protein
MNLCVERRLRHLDQDISLLLRRDVNLQVLQNFESFLLGGLEALSDDPGMEAFADVDIRLLKELADQEDGRRRAVASDVILEV